MQLTEELSARELAYVTALVGKDRGIDGSNASTVGLAAYEILHASCLTDIQATTYLHQFEIDLQFRPEKDTADELVKIIDRAYAH